MPDKNDSKKSAFEVLLPPSVKVMYGGKEREIKPLSMKAILEITQMLSEKLALFYREFMDPKTELHQKLVACISHIDEDDLIKILALILGCTDEDVKRGFRAYDALKVFEVVLEFEEVGKIFFAGRQIAEKMSTKSESAQSTG